MPNRLLFETSLVKTLMASRTSPDRLALFELDIDGFQETNEAAGTQMGDAVLRAVSKRIAEFAEQRKGYMARTGGDEFAVFFSSPGADDAILHAAADLRGELATPVFVDDREFLMEASIGVAVFPFPHTIDIQDDKTAASELMKQAKIALQTAKRAGRGMQRIYSVEGDDRRRNETVLRQSLRKAIGDRQFKLHYHPLVDLVSGEIVGAEALLRWNHPTLGLQRPDIFIPLAEKSGLIAPLGEWVLQEAMRQTKEWIGCGIKVPKIAINISGVQLIDPEFLSIVERALTRTGAQASQFELELTEGFMIEASPSVLRVLRALKTMGFTLAVDDFGTGHSSFRYLRDFPVDTVKIDQTFVREMVIDSSDASIIRAIITLAKSLDLDVIAEGIETPIQRNFLRDEGCRIGQGYLFSLPLAAEDFAFLLESKITLPVSASLKTIAATQKKVSRK